jgi:hypothetical protein
VISEYEELIKRACPEILSKVEPSINEDVSMFSEASASAMKISPMPK